MAEKNKNLEAFLKKTEKEFGKGSAFIQDGNVIEDIDSISTGSLNLDKAIGVGGIPKGRVIEIYGPESSGKSTICLELTKNAQQDGPVLFIDTEHALDMKYAKNLGVDLGNLIVSQPDSGEDALSLLENAAMEGIFSLVVVDSVAALTTRSELDGNVGDAKVGEQARLMSKALKRIVPILKKTNTTVIFTNQIRMKIGVMFGSPETTSGGNALKFYASLRLDIRRIKTNNEEGSAISNKVRVKTIKNKVAPPFREAEFDIVFGKGIDYIGELIDIAIKQNIIDKAGAWFSYEDIKIGQGKSKVRKFLTDEKNEVYFKEIEDKVLSFLNDIKLPEIELTEEEVLM